MLYSGNGQRIVTMTVWLPAAISFADDAGHRCGDGGQLAGVL
ncbi:hypothetical protein [Rhodanobacter sp. UC4436_H3]